MIKLVDCLKCVHEAGYVYNDLKQDNIMIELGDKDDFEVRLVDFGLVTKYKKNGVHINDSE